MRKKYTKYSNILNKDLGLEVSVEPTTNMMVCNAGLLTGVSEADIVNYFSTYGQVQNVCMIPCKSYSFLSFSNLDSAKSCYADHHENVLNVSGCLHLLYTKNLPAMHTCNNYELCPPGLVVLENFITEDEESLLMKNIVSSSYGYDKTMKHRSVKHFGYEFRYDTNNVDKNSPLPVGIPEELNFFRSRLEEKNITQWIPNQLTVNSYLPGQGIPPHVDTHSAFEDPIISLSLSSDVVMEFQKCDKTMKASVFLPRRSLLIMSGESRYYWTHGITPRKSDVYRGQGGLCVKQRDLRVSYTFRKILIGECNCQYPTVCDSYIKRNMKIPTGKDAKKIEEEYVHKVYDIISDHFSLTRHSPWPRVLDFLNSLQLGSVLVDIGCGNGKYFGCNKSIFHFGGDASIKLNMICKERGEVVAFNCLSLPLKDKFADGAICIAVLHHLSNEKRRVCALKEIYRILRPGGRALVYVWAMEQKSSNYVSKGEEDLSDDFESSSNVPSVAFINETEVLPIHSNRTQFKHTDLLVPWNIRLKNEKEACHLRYYHLFKEKELDSMCSELGAEILNSYYDEGNWCVELMKPPV